MRIVALAFVALLLFQSALGATLFVRTVGYLPCDVAAYYADKSLSGLLEVSVPHFLMIPLALMGSLHLLAFLGTLRPEHRSRLIHPFFLLFFADQLSPFAIAQGFHWVAYLKMVSFIGFELGLAALWWVLLTHTFKEGE